MVNARVRASNLRHVAYGKRLNSSAQSAPGPEYDALSADIATFVPGIDRISVLGWTGPARRAFQHDPSMR